MSGKTDEVDNIGRSVKEKPRVPGSEFADLAEMCLEPDNGLQIPIYSKLDTHFRLEIISYL